MHDDLPKFGTSGLRGRVEHLTPELVARYVRGFLAVCPVGTGLLVGRDLRESSLSIASEVIAAARACGSAVTDCGALPTPALALAAQRMGAAAVMVTGSHIPADRNGLKFYLPSGEITKADEAAILAQLETPAGTGALGELRRNAEAGAAYVARYVQAFGAGALAGLRLGIYQQSSVARDLLVEIVTGLGAEAVVLARSAQFIAVDTEAVDPARRAQLAAWCAAHRLDALLSTDGDADRPLLADGTGRLVPGDELGVLSALALGAEVICTPVSSNSAISQIPDFLAVHLTKIGSPFVLAAMAAVHATTPAAKVVGFEANGGFVLGFEAMGPAGTLPALLTRDAVLPMLATLVRARAAGQSLALSRAALELRATASDRLVDVPTGRAAEFLARLAQGAAARRDFLAPLGREVALDRTDGLRLTLERGRIVHLRASGNAPEFRVYVEAETSVAAAELLSAALQLVGAALR